MKVYEYNGDPRNLTMPTVALCAWYEIDKNGGEVFCGNRRKLGYGFCKPMRKAGFTDIEMIDTGNEAEGRWLFIFRHKITGVEVECETHGIDNLKTYEEQYIFTPRVYWNGSSTSNPELEQFAAPGFKPVMTFKEKS